MKNTKLFLNEFKNLENVLNANDYGSVLDYENNVLQNLDKEHLKMCRIARNHIVHSDDSFFEPSKEMINFISSLARKVDSEKGVAKDIMISFAKYGCVKPTDTLETAVSVIGKKHTDCIIVLYDDNTNCYSISVYDICKAISASNSYKKTKIQTVLPEPINVIKITTTVDTPINQIPNAPLVYVTDRKGKYKGVIVNE